MVRDLANPWRDLNATLKTRLDEASTMIEEQMDWASEYLGESERRNLFFEVDDLSLDTELQGSSPSAPTLIQTLASHQRLMHTNVEQACDKFEAALS
jgi:hypothetical protein